MKRLSAYRAGLVGAAFLAIWHVGWSLLVATGVAQTVIDLVFRLHMIAPAYHVGDFQLATAVELVLITGGIGYVIGALLGAIWNRLAAPVGVASH